MSARRVVACPDKFRGTLSASAAAAAMARGVGDGDSVIEVPLADGGEGTLEALLHAGGERRTSAAHDAWGRALCVEWGVLSDGTAVIEAAAACGFVGAGPPGDCMSASTAGVGEVIAAAIAAGHHRIILGVGGTATTDGGRGALEVLADGLGGVELIVACDVRTSFLDAAPVFAPQKGASPADVAALRARLSDLAARYRLHYGRDPRPVPGSGAAGGLAGGLYALGAELRPGADLVSGAVGLPAQLVGATLILTGEGCLDQTSFAGKVVGSVCALAGALAPGAEIVVVAGQVADDLELPRGRVSVISLVELAGSLEGATKHAPELAERAVRMALASRPVPATS